MYDRWEKIVRSFASLEALHRWKDGIIKSLGFARVAKVLARYNISPHVITGLSVVFAGVAVYSLFIHHLLFSVTILIHFILDGFDGWYARYIHKETALGELFDHSVDFIVGCLLLWKSYDHFGDMWMLMFLVWYVLEMVLIRVFRLEKKVFPSRNFVFFFIFGAYRIGLSITAVYVPISFLWCLYMKFAHKKNP